MPKLLVSEKYNFMDEVEQCASDPGKIALKWVNESSAVKNYILGISHLSPLVCPCIVQPGVTKRGSGFTHIAEITGILLYVFSLFKKQG